MGNYNGKSNQCNYKSSMRTRRIVTVSIAAIIFVLLVVLIAKGLSGGSEKTENKKKTNTDSKVKVEKTIDSSDEDSSNEDNSESESAEQETSTRRNTSNSAGVKFEGADAAYKESHKYCVAINRKANVVTVYGKDSNGEYTKPVKAFLCSTGKSGHETPAGTFKCTDKKRWYLLVGNCYGQYCMRINKRIYFHSVPYTEEDNSKLMTEEYNKLGQCASHGCVRLNCADSKWLYDNLDWETIIYVYDSDNLGPLGKPEGRKLDINDPKSGWDPTDPDEKNPWK
ncbi:MAG: L,D-transpeptidase family protein [Ruminococcaceae bacterium]|nr:L,D-transpeptidase family protein [Oscillospiraceae bacterium]